MSLIAAHKKDATLLAEMDALLGDHTQCNIWWLGQSGYLLQWRGKRILIDPYLSDSLTVKYAYTDKPHVRVSERVLNPHLLKGIDVITSSHNHTDHLDAATLQPVIANNPTAKLIIPEANRAFVAERLGCDAAFPIGLSDGRTIQLGEFSFHGVPAMHNEIERDEQGNCRYMGYVIAFDQYCIYHSGDTLWFDGMEHLLRPFSVNLALLPINGNLPERKVAGNLNCKEAAALGKAIGAKCVIPCHYDLFAFNTADVNEFVQAARDVHQPYQVLRGGERFALPTIEPI